jgi:hypothetical protein
MLLHPQLPSCEDCKRWMYDLKTGRRDERDGRPIPRPANVGTPCRNCPKIPQGAPPKPESATELTPENLVCVMHYGECKAVGRWPDDGRVARNADLLSGVEKAVERAQAAGVAGVLRSIGAALK